MHMNKIQVYVLFRKGVVNENYAGLPTQLARDALLERESRELRMHSMAGLSSRSLYGGSVADSLRANASTSSTTSTIRQRIIPPDFGGNRTRPLGQYL